MAKEKIRCVAKMLAFVLIFALLLNILSVTYFSKINAASASKKYSETMSVFNEPENTIQVVAIGNSDLYSGFCPDIMWQDYGYAANAVGSPRQTINESRLLLAEIFKSQSPSVVVIECDMIYDKNPDKSSVTSRKNSLDVMFDYMSGKDFEESINNRFSVFLFHSKWKNKPVNAAFTRDHGYKYSDNVVSVKLVDDFMAHTKDVEPISKKNSNDLLSLINLCHKNGAEVILVTLPSPSSWNYARYNGVREFAEEQGVPFLDLNFMIPSKEINIKSDFRDKGNHLNYTGATKATKYIAKYIHDNYDLADNRGDTKYEHWNNATTV